MVDETKNNIENEEDSLPSFLRSDNQENDIDHFLDGETNVSSDAETIDLGSWNDGFEDEENNSADVDFNLDNVEVDLSGWDDIQADDFLQNSEDINFDAEIDLDIFSDKKTEENIPDIVEETKVSNNVDDIIADTEMQIFDDEIADDIPADISIEDSKEAKYVDPEEYMSSDISLEELSTEETSKDKKEDTPKKKQLKESTFIDDVPLSETQGYRSLLIPQVKHKKNKNGNQTENIKTHNQKEQEQFLMCQTYSGKIDDIYFEFSSESSETAFAGNAVQNSIYVNIGISAYGWNVAFDNGIHMNLADVRIYQLRNGKLPADSGTLSYGNKKLRFSKVKRIVCASQPQYFHYGI